MTSDGILKTKCFIPPLRGKIVSRCRLVELINKNIKKKVLFLAAPAGLESRPVKLPFFIPVEIRLIQAF